ncbi:glycosyltransferase family 1 protein [soil metagenome]
MARIVVDLLYFTGRRGGTETYAKQVYQRFSDVTDIEFIGYGSSEVAAMDTSWFPGEVVDSGISGHNRAAWAIGEVFRVDRAARRLGADLLHTPANLGPTHPRVPVVATVHDLLPFRHPEWVPDQRTGSLLRWMLKHSALRATHILTDSEASRADIEEVFRISADRITVTPLAAGTATPLTGVERSRDLIFSPGNRMPHKNIPALLEALTLIPEASRPRLIVTGSLDNDPLRAIVERLALAPWVTLSGWMSNEELERTYAEAALVVFPTQFEGFGLPILEAMTRGCPVACSDLPVLREVAGDAAAYFDQHSPASIAATIVDLLAKPAALEALAADGLIRSAAFSWDRVAEQTLEVFRRTLASARS